MQRGLSIDDVGVSRDTVLREIRPGAGFETAHCVKEKLGGGATVVRFSRLKGMGGALARVNPEVLQTNKQTDIQKVNLPTHAAAAALVTWERLGGERFRYNRVYGKVAQDA